jgi:hypothetical protein
MALPQCEKIDKVKPDTKRRSNWDKYDNKQNLWRVFAMLQAAPHRRIGQTSEPVVSALQAGEWLFYL